jgi:hypothetical protein
MPRAATIACSYKVRNYNLEVCRESLSNNFVITLLVVKSAILLNILFPFENFVFSSVIFPLRHAVDERTPKQSCELCDPLPRRAFVPPTVYLL